MIGSPASSSRIGTGSCSRGSARRRFSRRAVPSGSPEVAAAARDLGRNAFADDSAEDPTRPPASGPVFVGGFAFADNGGSAPEWSGLPPACLVLPEVTLAKQGGEARLTLSAVVQPDDALEDVVERLMARVGELREAPMPLLDPDPVARTRVASAAPPSHYEQAVERAVERIRAGELQKVVLAREVRAHAARDHEPGAVFGALREMFPACYCWCVGTPEAAFVGASPELLVRRDGHRAQTVALAGTTRRSADPSVDDHLGEQLLHSAKDREEQAIVARRIERTLAPVSLWVAAADDPVLVKVQNVQHLATPIRAQLADPRARRRARRAAASHAGGGRRAARGRAAADPGARGSRPRLVRRAPSAGPTWPRTASSAWRFDAPSCGAGWRTCTRAAASSATRIPAAELAETEVKLQALLPLLS